jgi:hypothetical protein
MVFPASSYLHKMDANGNFDWVKVIDGDVYFDELEIDNSGNFIITGSFKDTVDFDPGPGIFNLYPPGSAYMYFFILKLDPEVFLNK